MRRRLLLAALAALATTARAATVAVDVGHFLDKPGATSAYGVPEFEYNHSLAAVIAARLAADAVAAGLAACGVTSGGGSAKMQPN